MLRNILGLFVLHFFCGIFAAFAQNSSSEGTENLPSTFPKKEVVVINSGFTEARPLISYDGNSLYFSRRYHPKNIKGEKDFQDIWVAHLDSASGNWSEPVNLGPVINNKKRNAIASLSPDGMDAIFFNTYKKTRRMPLVRSRKSGSSWTKPRVIHIDNYNNVSDYSDYFVDFKSKILILAIQADSTVGDQDLYVSFLDPYGGWKEPVNMGPVINSEKADFAPFMTSDGRALFFCSYGHSGQGGSDIFMSFRLDESWKRWSEPVNLGPAINTPHEETYFSLTGDSKYLYYTSYSLKDKDRNILRVELPDNLLAVNGPLLAQLDSATTSEILLAGNYQIDPAGGVEIAENSQLQQGAENKEAVAVIENEALDERVVKEIELALAENTENPPMNAPASGLSIAAEEMRQYLLQELPELSLEVHQKKDTTEFKIVQNLHYDFNSIFVKSEYLQRLSKMARILREKPALKIQFMGYTDNVGAEDINKKVAYQRVENLVLYFKDRKINADRIEIIGQGNADPIASNMSEEGRMQNRRVETTIRFIEK